MTLNAKTQMFPMRHGVDSLGWHLYPAETGKVIHRLRRGSPATVAEDKQKTFRWRAVKKKQEWKR